jgi:LysM repeat protein
MRSTGRRYMRIDNAVDDRMDPFRATEAAAQLLAYNYRLLGSWPLALTAYNHGAEGVRHAKETLGTDDIVKILREYKGRTFGFASRNFYVSFLAALEIDRNPEKYFGAVERQPETRFQEVSVPAFVQIASLERALKIDQATLRELNPALLRAVWDGQRHVPKSYHLRLPMQGSKWTSDQLAARLAPNELFAGQPEPRRYRVHAGDTVANVADRFGVTPEALSRANRMRTSAKLKVGRVISVPESTAGTLGLVASATGAANPIATGVVSNGPAGVGSNATSGTNGSRTAGTPSGTAAGRAPGANGSTANSAGANGAAASGSTASAGASTAAGTRATSGLYVVQSGDSLSDIASKFGMTEAQLLKLNNIRSRDFIFEGQQLLVTATPPSAVASTGGPAAALTGGTVSTITTSPPKSLEGSVSGAPLANTAVPSTNTPTREHLSGVATPPDTSPAPVVASGAVPAAEAARESVEEAQAVAKVEVPSEKNAQPVSAAQAEDLSPALGPGTDSQQNADPTDYSVAKDDTVRVAAAETLGHYADWTKVSAGRIRQLNHMSFAKPVLIGHKLKLDFSRVKREAFETKRREYHAELQATYFAEHRIIGTEVYIVRKGDALWTVTQRFDQLPIWLLQQYNPDVDLADLRPGTQIVMPRVENVVPGPG